MPYPMQESHFIAAEEYSVDMDLSDLLQTMKLDTSYPYLERAKPTEEPVVVSMPVPQIQEDIPEELMTEDPNYHSDTASESSSTRVNTVPERSYGCAYLQVIQSQMENYQTTGGEYLDVIFTHREILQSYPVAHQECARAFTDIAYALEKRAWRSDREADTEAVSSFRHEAWVIASQLAPVPMDLNATNSNSMSSGNFSYVCHGMPMM